MLSSDAPGTLVDMLYDIAGDPDISASSRLSAIKEILDRTVGKGERIEEEENGPQKIEIVFRIEGGDTNSG